MPCKVRRPPQLVVAKATVVQDRQKIQRIALDINGAFSAFAVHTHLSTLEAQPLWTLTFYGVPRAATRS